MTTSIYKDPVGGRIQLRTLNLDGDRQSDLTVHGGKDKAVYCYPLEHYKYWQAKMPDQALPMGAFGENFTTEGLNEESVNIGDQFSIGSAEVVVSQPRLPCYKLGIRFKSDHMPKRFLESRRLGFYLAVTREGEVGAGDEIRVLRAHPHSISVSAITRLYFAKEYNDEDFRLLRTVVAVESLAEYWKQFLEEKAEILRD